jgi:hypothetical protein
MTITDMRTFLPYGSNGTGEELLGYTVLGAAAASVTFTETAAKPWGRYSALRLLVWGRTGGGGATRDLVTMRLNGVVGAAYNAAYLAILLGGATPTENLNQTSADIGLLTTAAAISGSGVIEVLIPNTAIVSSPAGRHWVGRSFTDWHIGTTATWELWLTGGTFDNVAALTSMTLLTANQFYTGSKFWLYGLPSRV